jgi:hypothetical protein
MPPKEPGLQVDKLTVNIDEFNWKSVGILLTDEKIPLNDDGYSLFL